MFFVGISAHLFIYLLVPAFLIVCFYFKGITGHSEAITLLPEAVVCEHTVQHSTEKTYIYQIQEARPVQSTVTPQARYTPAPVQSDYVSFVYLQPALRIRVLRAPPVLS